jgi:hypothetical protein
MAGPVKIQQPAWIATLGMKTLPEPEAEITSEEDPDK